MRAERWGIGATLLVAVAASSSTAAPRSPDPPLPPLRAVPRGEAGPATPPLPPRRPRELDAVPREVFGPPMPPPARQVFGPPAPSGPREVFGPPMPSAPSTAAAPAPAATSPTRAVPLDEELACVRLLTGRKVEAKAVPAPAATAGGCSLPAPVEMAAILLADGRRVPFQPPVTVACPFGAAFADWVRDDLAAAFDAAGSPLVGLVSTSGYACRGRNGVAGAKLSEHARGDALDVGGFKTRDGAVLSVRQAGASLLATVRTTACARFSTVLGPGSDGFHEQHMHVDLEPRHNRSKICHWDLP